MPITKERLHGLPDFEGFEVLSEIGVGGMGAVYKARHLRLRRLVALKVLHPDKVPDANRTRRFLREARAASALAHPSIVTVYDLVPLGDQDILVMELVDGDGLDKRLEAGPLPWREAVEIALELGSALAAAHAAGIVHRDLKPSNVMLVRNAETNGDAAPTRPKVKLLDFGIAKLDKAHDAIGSGTTLTMEDGSPGTLAYMSPEQALGEKVDRRSDIFSFGTMLYEMLAGTRPFGGQTPAAIAHELVFASPQALDTLGNDVPPGLSRIVRRALAKKPEDRYQSVEDVCEELRTFCEAGPEVQSEDRAKSRRILLPVIVGLVLLLAASYPWLTSRLRPAPEPAEAPLQAQDLPTTPYQHYVAGMSKLGRFDREGYVDAAIGDFEAALTQDSEYAPGWSGLAVANLQMFRSKRDPVWLRRAAEHARRALELDPLLIDPKVTLARVSTAEGKPAEAQADLEQFVQLDPGNGDAWAALAEAAYAQKQVDVAVESIAKAAEVDPENWVFQAELGRYRLATGDLEGAESAFRDSLVIAPDNSVTRYNLGAVLHYQGRYPEAIAELQESITVRPTARGYTNLGTAYFFEGRYQEAVTALEAARDLGANYYIFWSNLGDAYRQVPGRGQAAIQCFERAVQLVRRELASGTEQATLRSRLASYLAKAGDTEAALQEVAVLEPLADQEGHVAYRATLVYEVANQRSKALAALATALEAGYPLVEVMNDPELLELREDVAFHELAQRFDLPVGA